MAQATVKTCRTCGREKPLAEFPPRKGAADGHRSECRGCRNAAGRSRWAGLSLEKRADRAAQQAVWNRSNRAKYREYKRRSRTDDTALAIAGLDAKVGASQRGAPYAEFVAPLVVLELHDGVCGICGEDVDPFNFELDHIVSLKAGGYHTLENLQPAHRACNVRKGGG